MGGADCLDGAPPAPPSALLNALREIVGPEHAHAVTPGGVLEADPSYRVEPGSVEEVSGVMKLASKEELKVLPWGGGTKLGWGNAPRGLGLILNTERLNRLTEHSAGDLVASVQAGMRYDALQAELAKSGQMLALDPPKQGAIRAEETGATIGGIIAANDSGPRRLRYGTVRDLLIGITVVLADGTVAKSGGKVVKNVAGYDLGKLYTGSFGTLGIIVEATFRLHPLPETARTVVVEAQTPEALGTAVQSLLHSALVPSAVEVCWPSPLGPGSLAVLIEGIEAGVESQTRAALELTRPHGEPRTLDEEEARQLWGRLHDRRERMIGRSSVGQVRLRVSIEPARLAEIVRILHDIGLGRDWEPSISGSAGTGVLLVKFQEHDAEVCIGLVEGLREQVGRLGGSVVVLYAASQVRARVDAWGPVGDALPLMRRVKERFDPDRILSPGRFVGDI